MRPQSSSSEIRLGYLRFLHLLAPRELWETSLPEAGVVLQAQEYHVAQGSSLLDGAPGSTRLSGNCSARTDLHSHTENQTCSKRQEYTGYPEMSVTV